MDEAGVTSPGQPVHTPPRRPLGGARPDTTKGRRVLSCGHRHLLTALLSLSAALLCATPAGAEQMRWGFETDSGGWTALGCRAQRTDRAPRAGRWALALSRSFPGTATLARPIKLDVSRRPRVRYHVFAPPAAGATLKTLLFLKSKDGLWYQCERRQPLFPGRWSTVEFDLSPNSAEVQPIGHFRRWGNTAAAEMSQIGIKVYSTRRFEGAVLLDDIRLAEVAAQKTPPPPLAITDFRTSTGVVPRFGKFELTFALNRAFPNPFDPERVAVDAEFTGPDGKKTVMPAFYYQDFARVDRVTKLEHCRLLEDFIPVGAGCWKVRFAPTQPGTYAYVLSVLDQTGVTPRRLTTQPRRFKCVASALKGYVRVAADRQHFEFSSGEPFYPIGHNVHSSNDVSKRNRDLLNIPAQDDHGTKAYDAVFRKMAAHGENLAEIWMASWSLDLEWTGRWKNYFGLGRYNLHHAWKLDRLLELAAQNGIYIHLALENHGKASTFCDPEWRNNPFNEDNGGFLSDCKDFFARRDARQQYKKKLRYIVARWGYSTQIMGFELWSEIDLTGNNWNDHGRPEFLLNKVEWHREIARYFKQINHRRHLLTTHYSGTYGRVQAPIARLPELDYLALDAYRKQGDIAQLLYRTQRALESYGKPFLVTEFGGSPMGTNLSRLEADLHSGLWAAYMMNHAGSPLLWWFMYIDRKHKYPHYRALANFAKGEDRRNRKLTTQPVTAAGANAKMVRGFALRNRTSAYLWIYDRRSALDMPGPDNAYALTGVSVTLTGFEPGGYTVEFWDTYRGSVVKSANVIVEAGSLTLTLPDAKNDIAVKVKPSRGARNGVPSSHKTKEY